LIVGKGPDMGGKRFALVHVEGLIDDPRPVNEFIGKLRESDNVVGVVIRVNSPGGVVGPSQEMYGAVQRLADAKPVVVSMGAVAASGGYYLSAPAHKIVANPGTLTGSIGVRLEFTNLMGLMDKLGISHESFVSGEFKDAPSAFKELTPEERAYLEALVMDLHEQFVSHVAAARGMELEVVQDLADGRIFTGRQALENGLVDELGGLEHAFDLLKELTNVKKDLPRMEGPEKETNFLRELIFGALPLDRVEEVYGPRWQALY
jgi:protease-4